MDLIRKEPVYLMGAINAIMAMCMGFGMEISGEQMGLVSAAAAAILSFLVRRRVSPN